MHQGNDVTAEAVMAQNERFREQVKLEREQILMANSKGMEKQKESRRDKLEAKQSERDQEEF